MWKPQISRRVTIQYPPPSPIIPPLDFSTLVIKFHIWSSPLQRSPAELKSRMSIVLELIEVNILTKKKKTIYKKDICSVRSKKQPYQTFVKKVNFERFVIL